MQKPMVQIWSKATYKAKYSKLGKAPTTYAEESPSDHFIFSHIETGSFLLTVSGQQH